MSKNKSIFTRNFSYWLKWERERVTATYWNELYIHALLAIALLLLLMPFVSSSFCCRYCGYFNETYRNHRFQNVFMKNWNKLNLCIKYRHLFTFKFTVLPDEDDDDGFILFSLNQFTNKLYVPGEQFFFVSKRKELRERAKEQCEMNSKREQKRMKNRIKANEKK